jgi:phytoene synthase
MERETDGGASSERIGEIVREAARAGEPDRYLAALLAPADIRDDLVAIAAFAAEIARIPSLVDEPMMGEIRLQWWRDSLALAKSSKDLTGNPVADALIGAVRRRGLDVARMTGAVDAAAFGLSGDLFADDAALEDYLSASEGAYFAEALAIAEMSDDAAAAVVRPAAIAYGMARTLLQLPARLHNGGFPIPLSRLEAAGVEPSALVQRPIPEAVRRAVAGAIEGLVGRGREALAEARAAITAGAGSRCRAALLPLVMVEPYFRLQSRVKSSPLEGIPDVTPFSRICRLGFAYATGRW